MKNLQVEFLDLDTPLGGIVLEIQELGLSKLSFGRVSHPTKRHPKTKLEQLAYSQLMRYFDKPHDRFTIPLLYSKHTLFRQRVWRALSAIKIGHTTTYKKIAGALNTHPRAVGGACAANPIPIIIPCHRVITQGGRLGGYTAANGLQDERIKAWLLNHERQCA